MSLKIVRNDITRMNTDAIVNTANAHVTVGTGCDSAVYSAAGYDKLLAYRKEKIGEVPEGEAFITPGSICRPVISFMQSVRVIQAGIRVKKKNFVPATGGACSW